MSQGIPHNVKTVTLGRAFDGNNLHFSDLLGPPNELTKRPGGHSFFAAL